MSAMQPLLGSPPTVENHCFRGSLLQVSHTSPYLKTTMIYCCMAGCARFLRLRAQTWVDQAQLMQALPGIVKPPVKSLAQHKIRCGGIPALGRYRGRRIREVQGQPRISETKNMDITLVCKLESDGEKRQV